MAQYQLANRATTTLNGGIDGSTTSIVVDDSSAFPSTGLFIISIDDEYMLVSANSSNTFTVTRGAEGSSAASHADDAAVANVVTLETARAFCREMGSDLSVTGGDSAAIGNQCTVSSNYSLAVGQEAIVGGSGSLAVGYQTNCYGNYSLAVGNQATCDGNTSICVGTSINNQGENTAAFGTSHTIGTGADFCLIAGQSNSVNNTYQYALGYANNLLATHAYAMGDNHTIEGANSLAVGSSNNVSSTHSIALGSSHVLAGPNSFAVGDNHTISSGSNYGACIGGYTNELTGPANNSALVGGANNICGSQHAVIDGGTNNEIEAAGFKSVILGGSNHIIGAVNSVIAGGAYHQIGVAAQYSFVGGGSYGKAFNAGQKVFSAYTPILNETNGSSQASEYILKVKTTDNTETSMLLDNDEDTTGAQVITIPPNSVWRVNVEAIASKTDQTKLDTFHVSGVLQNDGTTSTWTNEIVHHGTPAYTDFEVTVDTISDSLWVKFTGVTSEDWLCVAHVKTVELMTVSSGGGYGS